MKGTNDFTRVAESPCNHKVHENLQIILDIRSLEEQGN